MPRKPGPPANISLERQLLGEIIINPEALLEIAPALSAADFYSPRLGAIYRAALSLYEQGEPLDPFTLTEELKRQGQWDEETAQALDEIAGEYRLEGDRNYLAHAQLIGEKAERRRLMAYARQLYTQAQDETLPLAEITTKAMQALLLIGQRKDKDLKLWPDALDELLELLTERKRKSGITGLKSKFIDLDEKLHGLQPGNVYVLAGRPGMGKSCLAECIADNVMRQGRHVGFVSLEMPTHQTLQRRLVRYSDLSYHQLETGMFKLEEVQALIHRFRNEAGTLNFIDAPDTRAADLALLATRLKAKQGLDLLIIDYLQLLNDMQEEKIPEVTRVTRISRMVKNLARKLHVPILLISQLSRAVESREDKMPILADLRESGAIEADADAVIFIMRPKCYDPDCPQDVAEISVAKNRNGPTGRLRLLFDGRRFTFYNVTTEEL